MAAYELRNQQTGKTFYHVDGGASFALIDAYKRLDTDFPISVWQVFADNHPPLYLCTLIMNSDPKLGK